MAERVWTPPGPGLKFRDTELSDAIVDRIKKIVELDQRRTAAIASGNHLELTLVASEYETLKMHRTALEVRKEAEYAGRYGIC